MFVPLDSQKTSLRRAMSKEEAYLLLESIRGIEPLWIQDEKRREQEYKDAVKSGDCRRLIQIIKTIFLRKKKRMDDGKKVTAVDERYFNLAEGKLYGEMALALEMSKEEVKDYIKKYVEEHEN